MNINATNALEQLEVCFANRKEVDAPSAEEIEMLSGGQVVLNAI